MERKKLGGMHIGSFVKERKWAQNRLALLRILNVPRWSRHGEIRERFMEVASSTSTLHRHLRELLSDGSIAKRGPAYTLTVKGIEELRRLEKELSKIVAFTDVPTVRVSDATIIRSREQGGTEAYPQYSGTITYSADIVSPFDGSPLISEEARSIIRSHVSAIFKFVPGSHEVEMHFSGCKCSKGCGSHGMSSW